MLRFRRHLYESSIVFAYRTYALTCSVALLELHCSTHKSTSMGKEKTFWGIHAGKTGDAESLFEKRNVVEVACRLTQKKLSQT
jgi:hypothetical protein